MSDRPAPGTQVISVEEAADILRMGRSTLYRLIQENRVPHRVLPTGKKVMTQADIEQILADAHRPAVA